MSAVSEDFLEKLKNSIDIVDVVSQYVKLKKAGKNYKGLCPFHQEKTPSFNVNPEKQFYYCFGCNAGGDVLNFLMEIEHITFQSAIKILAGKANLEIPDQNPYEKKLMAERERVFAINQLAAKFYNYLLLEKDIAKKARDYLIKRGITGEDIEYFHLGYAPPGWRTLLNFMMEHGYSKEELVRAGLTLTNKNNNYYDRFRERIIFPIFNLRGEVLAFGGRIINSTDSSMPKYLNSPDTLIYKKGDNLYGFNWARETVRELNSIVIMEGYTDVLSAHKAGISNAVASLGTALTVEQARFLKRYADIIYIAYDADTAGTMATLRGLDILNDVGLNVRVVELPVDKDPDDFIREKGREGFVELQEKAKGLLDFKIEQIIRDKNLNRTDEKVDLTRKIIELLADLEDNIEQELYLHHIADRFQLSYDVLKKELEKKSSSKDSKKKDKNYFNRYTKKDNETNSLDNINRLEMLILKSCIDNPDFSDQIKEEYFSNHNRQIAGLILKNTPEGLNSVIRESEDEIFKKKLLALLVAEGKETSAARFKKMVDELLYQRKVALYKELQEEKNLTLLNLNHLLLYFQQLANNQEKGGIIGG